MRLNVFFRYRASPGRLRRLLDRIGPVTGASPVRRAVQAGCLVLFLWLFFQVCWPYGGRDHAADMAAREIIPAETFLLLDPLIGISATIAGRLWAWAIVAAVAVGIMGLVWPRSFCGYICPLGTLIDLFDGAVGLLRGRPGARRDNAPVPQAIRGLRYGVLIAVLVAAGFGVMLSGYVSAMAVATRGLQFMLAPVQMGFTKGWYLVPPLNGGHYVSIALFAAVFLAGLWRRRCWCRYACPTGALLSVLARAGLVRRTVGRQCISCDRCRRICPFDAIDDSYAARPGECSTCQTCAGVCPTGAIGFVIGTAADARQPGGAPAAGTSHPAPVALSRRAMLLSAASGIALAGAARAATPANKAVIRPPGSVPERLFLRLCVRCGLCYKACPNNVLQPLGLDAGVDMLWTPQAVFNWSGCDQTCNNCGQVCPTGAIRALPIEEKRAARMGLAVVNLQTCLPHAQREACQLCVDECRAAGYDAIEFRRVGVTVTEQGDPIPDTGFLAPAVVPDRCVGCGLCQNRCWLINVGRRKVLTSAAIVVEAGGDREDRIVRGSYRALRQVRPTTGPAPASGPADDGYLPDFLK